jgi:uncharacterized protein
VTTALKVFACTSCGHVEFPRRVLCPRCGTALFHEIDGSEGYVEETTVLRHRAGSGEALDERRLATVRTTAGPSVIAGLDAHAARGDRVALFVEANGAIVAVYHTAS